MLAITTVVDDIRLNLASREFTASAAPLETGMISPRHEIFLAEHTTALYARSKFFADDSEAALS
ncbi:MAG TPA: hypothetical protein VIS04_08910 [Woeseiaceae bacterium]